MQCRVVTVIRETDKTAMIAVGPPGDYDKLWAQRLEPVSDATEWLATFDEKPKPDKSLSNMNSQSGKGARAFGRGVKDRLTVAGFDCKSLRHWDSYAGGDHGRFAVIVGGVHYSSAREAARALAITPKTLLHRVRSGMEGYSFA